MWDAVAILLGTLILGALGTPFQVASTQTLEFNPGMGPLSKGVKRHELQTDLHQLEQTPDLAYESQNMADKLRLSALLNALTSPVLD